MTATHDELSPIPLWKLERFALGELPAEELARLHLRLETDAVLREQMQALRSADAEIRKSYPAAWMTRQIQARTEAAGRKGQALSHRASVRAWARWALVPVAAAALLAVVAVPGIHEDDPQQTTRILAEGVRSKGVGPTLYAHRRTPGGTERLEDGSAARRGDLVRLQYDGAGAAYGAILSIDGRGTLTHHLPAQGNTSVSLTTAGIVALDVAYELDDAPRWERFFLITGSEPFSLADIDAAARAAVAATRASGDAPERLPLPERLAQSALTLVKVVAPTGTGAQ